MKICHISTVHSRYDVRIFLKECISLAKNYKEVHLIIADGLGNETKNNVIIHDIGKPKTRKDRFLKFSKLALSKAKELQADVYHIHDPELLRIVLKLQKFGAKIIYDSHEDLPRQILNKTYIPKYLRKLISRITENYENKISKKLNAIIAATPHIRNRFLIINKNTVDINNFPIIEDIKFNSDWENRELAIGYIGGIFKTRGIFETLDAINNTDIKLHLAGNFSHSQLETECKSHPAWKQVEFHGYLDRDGVNELLKKVRLGMVILEATPSYIVSLPIKMFEYMAAGLPVIASDFPLWKSIIEESKCGVCVDQTNSKLIKETLLSLINDTDKLAKFGNNGRKAVELNYNWNNEVQKLYNLYGKFK
ncbi:MAG TPA: glycosyltransferase family 4 protein [Bacteroidales bacterium]|nr:glycosyltransferase family 4 protein [Bacteroidales bacterium]HQB21781.1 glycosyltransferase family 4 protein [Bacteroidales bacterium]